jgi:hypothetical protein
MEGAMEPAPPLFCRSRRGGQPDAEEPFVVILPSDHALALSEAIDPHDLVDETFIGVSNVPHVLRAAINDNL